MPRPTASSFKRLPTDRLEALGRIYDRYVGTVLGLARRVVSRLEDAEEVVQDVFTQVWRDAGRYRPDKASVAGWIVMLARTRAIDRLRSRRARPDEDRGIETGALAPLAARTADPETVTIEAHQGDRDQTHARDAAGESARADRTGVLQRVDSF